jgi:hypothetical protein
VGSSGSNSSDHHGDGRRDDRDSAMPARTGDATVGVGEESGVSIAEVVAVAELSGEPLLEGLEQPMPFGGNAWLPTPVDLGERGASARQRLVNGAAQMVQPRPGTLRGMRPPLP